MFIVHRRFAVEAAVGRCEHVLIWLEGSSLHCSGLAELHMACTPYVIHTYNNSYLLLSMCDRVIY